MEFIETGRKQEYNTVDITLKDGSVARWILSDLQVKTLAVHLQYSYSQGDQMPFPLQKLEGGEDE